MKVLGIDTATNLGTVAVVVDGRLRAEIAGYVRARHGETLLPHVERALALAGLEPAELDLVAVGLGPGSFTGLRVGVATAKGLALARGTPLVGVGTLRVVARGVGVGGTLVAPVLDARRGEVFAAVYSITGAGSSEVLAPVHGAPEAVAARLREAVGQGVLLALCGEGLRRYQDVLLPALGRPHIVAPAVHDVPRAALLVVEGEQRYHDHGADELATVEPLYLRPSDAELPQR